MDRRSFLEILALSSVAGGMSSLASCSHGDKRRSTAPKKQKRLNILVLGGTRFVGPAIVNAGSRNGHQITLFNRGVTNPELFPDLPLIKGDREKGAGAYDQLKNHPWDVVIDVWPEKFRLVDEATQALQDQAAHYVFISSIAVYKDLQEVGLHEGSEVVEPGPEMGKWHYSEDKVAAERRVMKRFPRGHTVLRPGPIKGWRDPALDLVYWLIKLKRNESILAPGSGKDPLQFIDVKDVGNFVIRAIENQLVGVYNCTGPRETPLLWDEFLSLAKSHLNSTSELHWLAEDFLRNNKVRSFEDLPLWAPLSEDRGFMQISNKKAVAAGLQFTPLQETIDECIRWAGETLKKDHQFGTKESPGGLERSRELQLIEKWKASQTAD